MNIARGQVQSNYESGLAPHPIKGGIVLLGVSICYRQPSHGSDEKERFSIRALSGAPHGVHTAARSQRRAGGPLKPSFGLNG